MFGDNQGPRTEERETGYRFEDCSGFLPDDDQFRSFFKSPSIYTVKIVSGNAH
jgi:hypothetical protein